MSNCHQDGFRGVPSILHVASGVLSAAQSR